MTTDVIDNLLGIEPGSGLDAIRAARKTARENAQLSYLALFEPPFPGGVSVEHRFVLATFVSGLHHCDGVTQFYRSKLEQIAPSHVVAAIDAEIDLGSSSGPWGSYPPGPLSIENTSGTTYQSSEQGRGLLDDKLIAALEHAHMLVFHMRDANHQALQRLIDAGWSTTDIVTMSQLVAFLTFQIRVVAGLGVLRDTSKLTHLPA